LPKVGAPEPAAAEPYIKQVEMPVKEQVKIPFEPEPVRMEAPKPQEHGQAPVEEKVVHSLHEEEAAPVNSGTTPVLANPSAPGLSHAEHQARTEERLAHMREVNMRLRTPNGLAEMEREPAFKRFNLDLKETPRSSDSNISRFTLTESSNEQGERQVELRRNNPFLHDNVD
jgi:cell division protein FtsZ